MVAFETIEKHDLTLEQIGLLLLLHISEAPLSEIFTKYDIDGLKLFMQLKEKGLIDFDLETDSVILLDDTTGNVPKEHAVFEAFRKQWPNKSSLSGFAVEFAKYKKACKKYGYSWKEELYKLTPAMLAEKGLREKKRSNNEFVPEWAKLSTWINETRWRAWSEDELQAAVEGKESDPMHTKYLEWYGKTFGNSDPERTHALTQQQYSDCRNFTGQIAKYKGKVSADRIRSALAQAHHTFFVSGRTETIYNHILKILG